VFLGAILTGGVAVYLDYKKINELGKQRKREALGQLTGRAHTILQLYATCYAALLEAEISKHGSTIKAYLNKLKGMKQTEVEDRWKQSIDFTTSQEAKNRSEDARLQLVKGIERFWTTITRIQISFSYIVDLNERVSLIENAWKALDEYELQSSGFGNQIIGSVDKLPNKLEFNIPDNTWYIAVPRDDIMKWGEDEADNLDAIIRSDRERLQILQADLKTQIDNLSNCLRPEFEKHHHIYWIPGYIDTIYNRIARANHPHNDVKGK